jgi:hypothetical protein
MGSDKLVFKEVYAESRMLKVEWSIEDMFRERGGDLSPPAWGFPVSECALLRHPEVVYEIGTPPRARVEYAFRLLVDWSDISDEVEDTRIGWIRVLGNTNGDQSMECATHTDYLRYSVLYG